MKRLKFLLTLVTLIIISISCSTENEKNYTNANVKGLWRASDCRILVSTNNTAVEELIKDWIGNPAHKPQTTANMFYFDGENTGIEGFEYENGDLDVIDRIYFSYTIKNNVFSIINVAGNSIDMDILSITSREFYFSVDMTDLYRDKTELKRILENAGITDINVDDIVINKVAAVSRYTKIK